MVWRRKRHLFFIKFQNGCDFLVKKKLFLVSLPFFSLLSFSVCVQSLWCFFATLKKKKKIQNIFYFVLFSPIPMSTISFVFVSLRVPFYFITIVVLFLLYLLFNFSFSVFSRAENRTNKKKKSLAKIISKKNQGLRFIYLFSPIFFFLTRSWFFVKFLFW
jgi:hypothetical protein